MSFLQHSFAPNMNILQLEHVNKSFGDKILFENLDLQINQGDRAALVARNGSGKSSLIRILAGIDSAEGERASIYRNTDIRLGYLSQDPDFKPDHTLLEAILDSPYEWLLPLKALYEKNQEHTLEQQVEFFKHLDEQHSWEVDASLRELWGKFKLPDFHFKVKYLSGGQKKRLALVKLLCGNPDFLILDEPTNHLDLDMIEWLERYLGQAQITLFMVTHDRYFLNNVCNLIYELDRGQLYKYQGDYEDYLEKKAIRMQQEYSQKEKVEKLLRKELEWVRRMPKARTTKNKARVDKFYDLKESIQGPQEQGAIEFEIDTPRIGTKVLEFHHMGKSFDSRVIIKDFSYKFKPNERIGIIGSNGTGKTSLLKLSTGLLKPDQGKIVIGETVQFGYYEQDGMHLSEDKRVIDVIRSIADYIPLKKSHKLSAEQLLERFLFPRTQQQVFVSQLSGGEKRRLYLLTVLISNPNFIILDEPTNDLDIITMNVLEEYLLDFPGCVLIVSHDRYFMDKIVQHVFVMGEGGHISDFPGNYSDYRESVKDQVKQNQKSRENQDEPKGKTKKPGYKDKREMDQIEKELEKLTQERDQLLVKFNDPELSSANIVQINLRLTEIQALMESKEIRWMELADQFN